MQLSTSWLSQVVLLLEFARLCIVYLSFDVSHILIALESLHSQASIDTKSRHATTAGFLLV